MIKRHLTKSHGELHSSITWSSCKIYQYSVHEEKAFLENKKWKRKWKVWHLRENFSFIWIHCLQQKMDMLFWKLENSYYHASRTHKNFPWWTPQENVTLYLDALCCTPLKIILTGRKRLTFHFSMGNDP